MLKTRFIIRMCIVMSIVLLPLAHLKLVLFSVPLYSVEMPILIAWLVYFVGWKQGTLPPLKKMNFRDPIIVGIGLFFLGAVISFVVNSFSLTGLGMLKTWFVFPLFLIGLLFQLQPNEQERRFFLNTWFAVTLLVACGALVYALIGHLTYDGRLAAWFGSPNYLAIFIAPGVLLAFQKLQKMWEEKEYKKYFFPSVSLFILLLALFFTHSYGVWLAVFCSILLMTFLSAQILARKYFLKILVAAIVVVGMFFFFEQNNAKWHSLISFEARSSLSSRMMIWQAATKMLSDDPLFGIGLGRFQEVYLEYQKYYPPYLEWAVPQPHNIVLAVWLQTGLLGFVGFVLLITRSIYVLLQNKNREATLLLGLIALTLVYGIFDTPFFKTDLAFTFWLVIGLILTLSKPDSNHSL